MSPDTVRVDRRDSVSVRLTNPLPVILRELIPVPTRPDPGIDWSPIGGRPDVGPLGVDPKFWAPKLKNGEYDAVADDPKLMFCVSFVVQPVLPLNPAASEPGATE